MRWLLCLLLACSTRPATEPLFNRAPAPQPIRDRDEWWKGNCEFFEERAVCESYYRPLVRSWYLVCKCCPMSYSQRQCKHAF